ncbi:hypothetical protein C4D60_Mb04t06340 [Musa balbisiana]|uniref:Uncharacterized protein n=1 Tax=Musa balbisiana TaxID=52838 RepID=A0A4V4H9J9_MUSBA|nr:hypothetical protein C4D60_Mb04t06340 [Musa balbisiana]
MRNADSSGCRPSLLPLTLLYLRTTKQHQHHFNYLS